jgi:NCS1 family nucleobase:cation symporter-1
VSSYNGWDNIYNLSYFFGFIVSGFLHWALHTLFPAPKQTGGSPFVMELHAPRIDGVAFVDSHLVDVEAETYITGEEKEGKLEIV